MHLLQKVIEQFSSLFEVKNSLSLEFGGRLDAEILTQFVDAGGNVLVAGSNTVGDAIREFAGECGIEFADDKSAVIDHLNYDVNDNGQVRKKSCSIQFKAKSSFVRTAYISCCKPK